MKAIQSRRGVKLLCLLVLCAFLSALGQPKTSLIDTVSLSQNKSYIRWVTFNVPLSAMTKAMKLDIESQGQEIQIGWIETLAYCAAKYGGNWGRYKGADIDHLAAALRKGESLEDLAGPLSSYPYFTEAYSAVLGNYLGRYQQEVPDENGGTVMKTVYGLKAFSPVAKGFGYSHYRDFGDSRSYGYSRPHLGNDLLGTVGTPIVAVESGVVEVLGWNQYGGWRVAVRSFDGRRSYYYAHLRKGHPYAKGLKVGQTVWAGDVIGYLGMTGYSTKEDVNNMKTPHLHFGIQLIFDESQKEGTNQIWIDVYNLVELLSSRRSAVQKIDRGEYQRQYAFIDLKYPDHG